MSATKWLPVATTARHDGRAPQPRRRLREPAARGGGERRADREREAGVEAGHGRVLVVERGRQLRVEREPGLARDRVDEADVRQPRRRDREQGVDRQRDQPGREHRVAQQHVVAARAPVQADQRARDDDELGCEVEVVEEPQRRRCRRRRPGRPARCRRPATARGARSSGRCRWRRRRRRSPPGARGCRARRRTGRGGARGSGAAQHHAAAGSARVPSARSRNHSSEPGRPQTSR